MAEDTGQAPEQTAPEGQQEGGQAPDLSALDQRIGEMTGKLDDLSSRFDQAQPEQGEVVDPGLYEQQYQQDPYAGQYDPNQQYADPNQFQQDPYAYDPQAQMDPQAAQAQIQQMVQQAAAQQVAPVQQQLSDMQAQYAAAELEQEFPDLQKQEVVEQLMPEVEQLAQAIGHPEAAGEPALIRMAYLAQNAQQSAGQETPVGGAGQVQLEGGGARQSPDEPNEEDRMIAALERRTPQWGVGNAA